MSENSNTNQIKKITNSDNQKNEPHYLIVKYYFTEGLEHKRTTKRPFVLKFLLKDKIYLSKHESFCWHE